RSILLGGQRSQVVCVLLELPGRDGLDVRVPALELVALDLEVRRHDGVSLAAAEALAEHLVALQRRERLAQRARERRAPVLLGQLVRQAGERRRRIELPADPV